jgi:hypothetical protein
MLIFLFSGFVLALNWPSAEIQCQVMTENVTVVSDSEQSVKRGSDWLVTAECEGHETATLWIYDTDTNREIVKQSVLCGGDGRFVVFVRMDERFDGVRECWMWVLGN